MNLVESSHSPRAEPLQVSYFLRAGLCCLLILCSPFLSAQKFLPDDPLWVDSDRRPVEKPRPIELGQIEDYINSSYSNGLKKGEKIVRSQNVNTLGGVPDSSWFTNRIGRTPMSLQELARGAAQRNALDLSVPWVVVQGKSEGISPGFTIRDGRGNIYFVKFDPLEYPQLATSTEVITSKFFHAFGYNVPEYYLALVRREDVEVAPDAKMIGINGRPRRMRERDVTRIFERVPIRPDGSTQVIASRALPGIPLGPFQYFGVRPDDSNDIFPHQNRRELRGLRVLAAWVNHDDCGATNSLNTYIEESGGGYLKHHLLDFGSCFGSGSIKLQSRRAGYEHVAEMKPSLKAGLSLGWWDRPWRHIQYRVYPAVGRYEAAHFEPDQWKTEYPNPAFIRMLADDALWATRILMRFTDEVIRAIVDTGRITDPEAEDYLVDTLIQRRDKICRHFLTLINPLSDFRISNERPSSQLEFRNLGEDAGFSGIESYQYQWFRFDNLRLNLESLGEAQTTRRRQLPIPKGEAEFLMVRIRTVSPQHPAWKKGVEVFLRNGKHRSVVGLEREL